MAQLHSQMSSQSGMSDTRFRDMYQGIEKDSLAYKMMSSMGWKEGEGLVSVWLHASELSRSCRSPEL